MNEDVMCEFVTGPVDGLIITTPSVYTNLHISILDVVKLDSDTLQYYFKCSVQPFVGSTHYRFTSISDAGQHIYTPYE